MAEARFEQWLERATSTPVLRTPPTPPLWLFLSSNLLFLPVLMFFLGQPSEKGINNGKDAQKLT
jgi:hypothetical protein